VKQSIKQMNRCAFIKARLQWDSFSNNNNSTWWWPYVAETCCTSVKTDVLKVALKTVIMSVKTQNLSW
jgi:hypothetical protein